MSQNDSTISYSQFEDIVSGYLDDSVSDKQMSDWIELIFERGMSNTESADYTKAIINSGIKIDFKHLDSPIVDKHSTGGVGDKVSLVLGPLLAAYGYHVPMIVGRSLGHTGGTLDKLCSIPGYRPYLDIDTFKKNVEKVGVSIMGQTEEICPADRKIYALRDRINRIASYPLICGSIMSKKIAEGIQGLVLDIKTGNGAFMYNHKMAQDLGALLSDIGKKNGLKMKVVVTDMSQPLGKLSGVGCEVIESIDCLKGMGDKNLMSIVYHLALELIEMFEDHADEQQLRSIIDSGKAYDIFVRMVESHGGSMIEFEKNNYGEPRYSHSIISDSDGYIESYETRKIGELLSSIGAGTLNNKDGIDNHAGLSIYKNISDKISKGERLMDFYCSSEKKINNLMQNCCSLFKVSENITKAPRLIY